MQLEYTCYGTLVPFPQYGSTSLNVLVRSIQPHSYHVPVPTAVQCLPHLLCTTYFYYLQYVVISPL